MKSLCARQMKQSCVCGRACQRENRPGLFALLRTFGPIGAHLSRRRIFILSSPSTFFSCLLQTLSSLPLRCQFASATSSSALFTMAAQPAAHGATNTPGDPRRSSEAFQNLVRTVWEQAEQHELSLRVQHPATVSDQVPPSPAQSPTPPSPRRLLRRSSSDYYSPSAYKVRPFLSQPLHELPEEANTHPVEYSIAGFTQTQEEAEAQAQRPKKTNFLDIKFIYKHEQNHGHHVATAVSARQLHELAAQVSGGKRTMSTTLLILAMFLSFIEAGVATVLIPESVLKEFVHN